MMLGSAEIAGGGGSYASAGERLGAGDVATIGGMGARVGDGLAEELGVRDGEGEGLGVREGAGMRTTGVVATAGEEGDATTDAERLGEGSEATTRWLEPVAA